MKGKKFIRNTNVDEVSQANLCKEVDPKEITLKQLKPREIAKGRILWLKNFYHPHRVTGIMFCVEDKEGTCALLSLYNQLDFSVSDEQIREEFPIDCEFGIKNPYLKIT